MVKRKLEEVTFEDSSSTPRPAFKRPAYSSSASITQVPLEVSQMALNVDVDMDTGAYPVIDNQSSPSPPWSAQSNYPPNSNTLYPFPSVEDSTMECDNNHAGDVSTAHQENRPAFDPAYSRVVDNRYHSNASTVSTGSGLMQPQQDAYSHHGTHCKQIPKIRLSQYPNANGERTMWTHCEECGAIEMIQGCNGSPLSVPSS